MLLFIKKYKMNFPQVKSKLKSPILNIQPAADFYQYLVAVPSTPPPPQKSQKEPSFLLPPTVRKCNSLLSAQRNDLHREREL